MSCKAVAFVGRSGSGKTTLITRLIPELTKLNLKVGSLKHTHQKEKSFDHSGKDSWKHRQAGAGQVMLLSEVETAIFAERDHALTIEAIKEKWFSDYDLLVIEGFKNEPILKVEVYRTANPKSPLYNDPAFSINALVTDASPPFPLPHFNFDQIDELITWILHHLS